MLESDSGEAGWFVKQPAMNPPFGGSEEEHVPVKTTDCARASGLGVCRESTPWLGSPELWDRQLKSCVVLLPG